MLFEFVFNALEVRYCFYTWFAIIILSLQDNSTAFPIKRFFFELNKLTHFNSLIIKGRIHLGNKTHAIQFLTWNEKTKNKSNILKKKVNITAINLPNNIGYKQAFCRDGDVCLSRKQEFYDVYFRLQLPTKAENCTLSERYRAEF